MAYQLSTIRTRIQQKLDNTAFDTAKINQFVNDGQRDLCNSIHFPNMEVEATATTADGSDEITFSTIAGTPPVQEGQDIQRIISMRIYSPTDKATTLPATTYEYIDEYYPNVTLTDENTPTTWYMFGNTIKIFPIADTTYTLRIRYLKVPDELVNDADVPEVPEEFGEALVLAGYKRALEHEDNFDQAQIVQIQLDELKVTIANRLGRREIGTTSTLKKPYIINRR